MFPSSARQAGCGPRAAFAGLQLTPVPPLAAVRDVRAVFSPTWPAAMSFTRTYGSIHRWCQNVCTRSNK